MFLAHKVVLLLIPFASRLVNLSLIDTKDSETSLYRAGYVCIFICTQFLIEFRSSYKKELFYHQVLKKSNFLIFWRICKGLFLQYGPIGKN